MTHDNTPRNALATPTITWQTEGIDMPSNQIKRVIYTFSAGWLIQCILTSWLFLDSLDEMFHIWAICMTIATICLPAFTYDILRKTQFSYIIHTSHGEETKQLKHSPHTRFFFSTFANLAILTLIGAAIYFMSFLPIIIFFIASLPTISRLKNWQPPPAEHYTGLPWSEYNFVTVDRKYAIIVVHVEDPTVGFETRFPNRALFEQYLTFLQTVLPPTAQYTEKVWEW
ncbi:hypothetical protein [Pseudomonas sp. StFLB209]|uniref:hypothetical protein n=1 Tax=Pseudomonas sp. StFLB209 TaxID=1028989 RepID=UPI00118587A3|nr:hypothetical protein [Pseudomonas sp. StFLB209]